MFSTAKTVMLDDVAGSIMLPTVSPDVFISVKLNT